MKKSRKLSFIPIIYRDWSVVYCEIGRKMVTTEFRKQFGWQFSDYCCLWDGKKVAIYRDRIEQAEGMAGIIIRKLKKDKQFIAKLTKKALKEVDAIEIFYKSLLKKDFVQLAGKTLHSEFQKHVSQMANVGAKLLITQYFPTEVKDDQQKKKYKKEIDLCMKTRTKWEKRVAPLSDQVSIRFGESAIEKIGMKKELSRFLTIKEIERIFLEKNTSQEISQLKKEINQRKKYYLLAGGDIWNIKFESYLKKRGWQLAKENMDNTTKEIKGSAAYIVKKIITGRARIIHNKREISKLKKGEILVTPALTPEYAPIYKKILAIITEEGGITCHAAIVARELKIPCIIGTKIATKFFKDGDSVAVDTSKGLAKIIK